MTYSCWNIVHAVWFDFFFVFILNTPYWLPFVRTCRVVDLRCLISAFLSSSLMNILFVLFISVWVTEILCCRWWFDPKLRYWSVCEAFSIPWTKFPHFPPLDLVCPKGSIPSHSFSILKFWGLYCSDVNWIGSIFNLMAGKISGHTRPNLKGKKGLEKVARYWLVKVTQTNHSSGDLTWRQSCGNTMKKCIVDGWKAVTVTGNGVTMGICPGENVHFSGSGLIIQYDNLSFWKEQAHPGDSD